MLTHDRSHYCTLLSTYIVNSIKQTRTQSFASHIHNIYNPKDTYLHQLC